MMRTILLSCTLFILSIFAQAQTVWTVETVPNPKEAYNGFVSNPDHILSEEYATTINMLCQEIEDSTTAQVAVLVVQSIGDAVPKDFSTALLRYWGVGQKANNNGLLILLVIDQRRMEFETGYGMEAVLTDAMCKRIQVQYMIPYAKEANYDDATLAGVQQVKQVLLDPKYRDDLYAESINQGKSIWRRNMGNSALITWLVIYAFIAFVSYKQGVSKTKKLPAYIKNNQSKNYIRGKYILLNGLIPAGVLGWQLSAGSLRVIEFLLIFYVLFGFILFEKRLRYNRYILKDGKNDEPQDLYSTLAKSHSGWFAAGLFFPFPFLIYSVFRRGYMKRLRMTAPLSADGKTPMVRLDEKEDDSFLKDFQITEEKINSVDYDVWVNKATNETRIFRFENFGSRYKTCPSCHAKAYRMTKKVTITAATYEHSGTGEKIFTCKNCRYEHRESFTIPMLTRSSSSGSGGSGGGGGGSFGGGGGGGGGAGSSW